MKGSEHLDMAGSSAYHCMSRCFSNCFWYKARNSHQDTPLQNGFSNIDEKNDAKQGRNSFVSKKLAKVSIENGCCTRGRGRDDSLYTYEHVPSSNESVKKSFSSNDNGLIIPCNGSGNGNVHLITNLQPTSKLTRHGINEELENNRNAMVVNPVNPDTKKHTPNSFPENAQTTHNNRMDEHDTHSSFKAGPGNTIPLMLIEENAKISNVSRIESPDTSIILQKPDSEEEGLNTHINSGYRKGVIKTSDCVLPNIECDVFRESNSEYVNDDATTVRLADYNKDVVPCQALDNAVPPISPTTELNVNMKSKLFNEKEDLPSSIIVPTDKEKYVDSFSMNNSKLQGEHDIAYFREIILKEKQRLEDLLTYWDKVFTGRSEILEEAQDEIRSVIGQTHQVISERFTQFASLVDQSEKYYALSNDEQAVMKPVTLSDLQGFWDMIYYQVEDVLMKFQRLDKAKDCNWKLEDSNNHKYLPRKKVVKKTVTRRNPAAKKVTGSSKVISPEEKARKEAARKRLAEARKKMAAQRQLQSTTVDGIIA